MPAQSYNQHSPAATRPGAAGLAALIGIPALCAGVIARHSEFTKPMGGYWTDAVGLVTKGRVPQDFTPAGYPELLAIGMRLMPSHLVGGVIVMQVLLHIAIAVTLFACLRAMRVKAVTALVSALLLQLHPELIVSVVKVWDVPYSTFLLLLLELCLLLAVRKSPSTLLLIGTGVAFGLGLFERPNFILLAPVLAVALWMGRGADSAASDAGSKKPGVAALLGVPLAVAAVVYVLSSLVAFHRIDTPHNGPYNVFAGHNQLSRAALLSKLNAEPSLIAALTQDGYPMPDEAAHADSMGPLLSRLAKEYALSHPKEELVLSAVKLFTLLRPDTKVHGFHDSQGKSKYVLALAVPLWIVVLVWKRRWLERADWLLIVTAALYVVPFLLTNSDPRFRTPLDLMVLTHTVALIAARGGLRSGALER